MSLVRVAAVVVRRSAAAVLVLAVLSVLIFAVTEVLPGDAVGAVAGTDATMSDREQLRREFGLDAHPVRRYVEWAGAAVQGDLGTGYVGRREVTEVLAERLPNSLLLTTLAMAMAVPLAVVIGLLAGMRAGRRTDRLVSTAALVAVGIPEFLVAALLVAVFAAGLGLLPEVSLVPLGGRPWDEPRILVLPVAALSVAALAAAARLLRASVAEIAAAPYVEAARLRGVTGLQLAVRHVLPNAVAPAVQVTVVMFAGLIGGAVVVETLFNYPGIGYELQQAVANRDVPMVQGLALATCATALVILLLGDLVQLALSPTLRGRS
ncbi:peptide/nickel transport system permease protein [Micromonospora sp. Llam0]|uniref:ABC transporter permease n=1 Tax=Micromonospora sp. Llam0 TaxID=2485143 RepID=UPI000F9981E9|nr:ABC transporter permease [Micromonospora sp. Llam0]ROO59754.1 peptide/nickel transport system permease protein [Micromonospora sp. Llam0]